MALKSYNNGKVQSSLSAMQLCALMLLVMSCAVSEAFMMGRGNTGANTKWNTAARSEERSTKATRLYYMTEGGGNSTAEPFAFTAEDLSLLTELRSRHKTIPIIILDAMVPKQRMTFQSTDPKFHKLVEYVVNGPQEIGMLGYNPHTGEPLNTGVTLYIRKDNIVDVNKAQGQLTITVQGQERFEVQGEPWLDDETGSFYFADIEIVQNRREEIPDDIKKEAKQLSRQIPDLVQHWLALVLDSGKADKMGMELRLKDMGKMPDNMKDRAMWVAALLNPIPNLDVCSEIRPAMLCCRNNYDRMILSCTALQSSIDYLSGKKELL